MVMIFFLRILMITLTYSSCCAHFSCKNNNNYCYSDAESCDFTNDCGDNTDETSCSNIRCNFESNLCKWRNVKGEDNFDWTRNQGKTGSIGTGPSQDHTTGKGKTLTVQPPLWVVSSGKCLSFGKLHGPSLEISHVRQCYSLLGH